MTLEEEVALLRRAVKSMEEENQCLREDLEQAEDRLVEKTELVNKYYCKFGSIK